jgi:oxalate decarboxylase/phosphoglucose isomerase-like protein (cupin superfamily)
MRWVPPGARGWVHPRSRTRERQEAWKTWNADLFIPDDALHSCENTGASDLRVAYAFPADSFDEVEYVFEG